MKTKILTHQDTDKSIIAICYESGFNTSVNFNKQFCKIKKMPPRSFRNSFVAGIRQAFRIP